MLIQRNKEEEIHLLSALFPSLPPSLVPLSSLGPTFLPGWFHSANLESGMDDKNIDHILLEKINKSWCLVAHDLIFWNLIFNKKLHTGHREGNVRKHVQRHPGSPDSLLDLTAPSGRGGDPQASDGQEGRLLTEPQAAGHPAAPPARPPSQGRLILRAAIEFHWGYVFPKGSGFALKASRDKESSLRSQGDSSGGVKLPGVLSRRLRAALPLPARLQTDLYRKAARCKPAPFDLLLRQNSEFPHYGTFLFLPFLMAAILPCPQPLKKADTEPGCPGPCHRATLGAHTSSSHPVLAGAVPTPCTPCLGLAWFVPVVTMISN